MKYLTEWVVENLNDEGFLCGDRFPTKAEADAYAEECRRDGLQVLNIHPETYATR